jgi:hypothetical protein
MISSSSSSFCSQYSKLFPTSKDWTVCYEDSHVDIDPKIVFGKNTSTTSPHTLESMILPSNYSKSDVKDWMTESYENIQGYPSTSIKRDVEASSFQKQSVPLEPSYSIDASVYMASLSSNMESESEEGPDDRIFSIDSTSSLLKEIDKNQAIHNQKGKIMNYYLNDNRYFLMSNDTGVLTDPESFPLTYHGGHTMQHENTLERCNSLESCLSNFSYDSQPIPSLDDSIKVSKGSAGYSSTKSTKETPSPLSTQLHTQMFDLPSYNSIEDVMAVITQKNQLRNDKKRCPILYVTEILPTDVLLGRGGRANHHPGNIEYRKQVGFLAPDYFQARDKRTKTLLSTSLVDWVQKEKLGRFIKLEKSTTTTICTSTVTTTDLDTRKGNHRWYIVSNVVACRKAAQALRECVTRNNRIPNSNT